MLRRLKSFLLCLAVLGLQQQLAVHAYEHVAGRQGEAFTAPHESASCATCELLASGANGVASHLSGIAPVKACAPVLTATFATRAIAAPACYRSRAPPAVS